MYSRVNSITNGEEFLLNSYETKHNNGSNNELSYTNQCMLISILHYVNRNKQKPESIHDIRLFASSNNMNINRVNKLFDTDYHMDSLRQVLRHYQLNLYIYIINNNNKCIRISINNEFYSTTIHIVNRNSHFELMTNINGCKFYNNEIISDNFYNYNHSINEYIHSTTMNTMNTMNTCSYNIKQLLTDKKSYLKLLTDKKFELEAENHEYINHLSNDPNDEALNKIIRDTHNDFIDKLKLELSELSKLLKKIDDDIACSVNNTISSVNNTISSVNDTISSPDEIIKYLHKQNHELLNYKHSIMDLISEKEEEYKNVKNELDQSYELQSIYNQVLDEDYEHELNTTLINTYFENINELKTKLNNLKSTISNLSDEIENIIDNIKNNYDKINVLSC
jgi:RNA polymerase-binding transcription factor DksA